MKQKQTVAVSKVPNKDNMLDIHFHVIRGQALAIRNALENHGTSVIAQELFGLLVNDAFNKHIDLT